VFRKTVTGHLTSVENVNVFFTVLPAYSIAAYLFRLKWLICTGSVSKCNKPIKRHLPLLSAAPQCVLNIPTLGFMLVCPIYFDNYITERLIKYITINCGTSHRIRTFCPDPARKLSANLYDIHQFFAYSEKLLMMDRETVRNM